ncbi:hypothetical protein Tco_0274580, partial [Tanacetum coccineum]
SENWSIRRIGTQYGVSGFLGVGSKNKIFQNFLGLGPWVYGELAENVLLMIFDQSIIYGVSADVDTAYSSKSGNGLEFFKVIRYGV